MAKMRRTELVFPVGGLDKSLAIQRQRPYTTADCLNVRPHDLVDGRERGGSRPGLRKAFSQQIDSENSGRLLAQIRELTPAGGARWRDDFEGTSLGSIWETVPAAWGVDRPTVVASGDASCARTANLQVATVHAVMDLDSANDYVVTMRGLFYGTWDDYNLQYHICLRMDDATPDITDAGVVITLRAVGNNIYGSLVTLSGGGQVSGDSGVIDITVGDESIDEVLGTGTVSAIGAYNAAGDYTPITQTTVYPAFPFDDPSVVGETFKFDSGSAYPIADMPISATTLYVTGDATGESDSDTFKVVVLPDVGRTDYRDLKVTVSGDTLTVFFDGRQIYTDTLVTSAAGDRWGFAITQPANVPAEPEDYAAPRIDAMQIQYTRTGAEESTRVRMVASANGAVWSEDNEDNMAAIAEVNYLTLASDKPIQASQRIGQLYIADVGSDTVLVDSAVVGNGTITDGVLDVVGVDNWLTRIPTSQWNDDVKEDPVVVITSLTNTDGIAAVGVYSITAISDADGLTLNGLGANDDATAVVFTVIDRGPKVYDPVTDTMSQWVNTIGSGILPTRCPLICTYRDRVVLAGYPAHEFFMSKQGDPLDWDYAGTTVQRAIAGTTGSAERLGDAIKALIPHSSDTLIIGCRNSIHVLRGDLTSGGRLDVLSNSVGVLDAAAWCHAPDMRLVFLSPDGLYILEPGINTFPQAVSARRLPNELKNVDPDEHIVSLAYDKQQEGIHIFLTPKTTKAAVHYWLKLENMSLWPVAVPSRMEAMCMAEYDADHADKRAVLLFGRDGHIRKFDSAWTDDGVIFSSYVFYGPIRLGGNDDEHGSVEELSASVAASLDTLILGDVTWSLYVADSAEKALGAVAVAGTGTWLANTDGAPSYVSRPCRRGRVAYLKLAASTVRPWAIEGITIGRRTLGPQVLL